ncbi:hypothetical protein DOS84_01965 [Flavobacterium aquariorum]|uniref:Uncharacterized protein n=1 Tax=Flavobacterium aquariorum TaxID=2217670 RepID=A0A2W7VT98_9FLAO|nr:hypothetical protein DOS84_01965 [Flavobacterium aquariorum]
MILNRFSDKVIAKFVKNLERMKNKKTIRTYKWFMFFSPDGNGILLWSRQKRRDHKRYSGQRD